MEKTISIFTLLVVTSLFCCCDRRKTPNNEPAKDRSYVNVDTNGVDTLPNVTNSWGNEENVAWIMDQLFRDTVPVFDFSPYNLSEKEEKMAEKNLRIAWYGEETFFEMDYIRQHYDKWKYVWRIFHIPNYGELACVEQDVILKLYLKKHQPELLMVGKDRSKHYANLRRHVMDSLTLDHEFLGKSLNAYCMNIVWFDYLRWYHVQLYNDDLHKIGINIDNELSHADKIRAAVERYKDNTPHFGSGDGDRYAEFYMLYSSALDTLIDNMCNMCEAKKAKQSHVKRYTKVSEQRLWREFYKYEEYDEGHWEIDSAIVVGMEPTRERTNIKARQYKPEIKRSYRRWLAYRQHISRSLAPKYRKAYDDATIAFQNFIMAQCKIKFQYQID